MLVSVFMIDIGQKLYAQTEKKQQNAIQNKENYNRPSPSKPITPVVPDANRYRSDKIFLEYADSLYKTRQKDTVERQILKGNVKFRQAGMWMFCDSAYYYPQINSLDAFGNVRMEQGDTLFVYADKLFYDGNEKLAKLLNGPSEPKVRLINKDVTLTTDSLDYDLANEMGWYLKWGTIDDKVNTLTSKQGYYSPDTKDADFYIDVVLVNNKDGYRVLTDTLYYNTSTHIAKIESLAYIQSENDTIVTTNAIYDTDTGNADLLSRSVIIHKDSTGNVITLEGDSIIYDKATHISKAYMYRDPLKKSNPMVITDTAQNTQLIGGFGIYNDSTREAMAYIYPLLIEYSQADTLFLRADTIKTYIVTEMVPGEIKHQIKESPLVDDRPLVIIDSLNIYLDSIYFSVNCPLEWMPLSILEANTDRRETPILEPIEIQDEFGFDFRDTIFNTSSDTFGTLLSDSTVMAAPMELPPGEYVSVETDNKAEDQIEKEVNPADTIPMVPKDFYVALAYNRGRFFKKDIQGVADSIVVIERDSMMYLFRKPIIWSGERQVTGNRIDVHFNDSTADWAKLPESGMMSEYIDEDFYNQIAGKEMYATFADQSLKTLDVSGNVETIFLPQEQDSTFNRLVAAESSFLTLELDSGKMEKLKMWPEVNGTVTPIFLVKRSQQYLRNFHWWESLRPQRAWYGNSVIWADDLGEVPDALEAYFLAPSDFGEPKSFSGTRFVAPASTLYDWDEKEAMVMEPENNEAEHDASPENDEQEGSGKDITDVSNNETEDNGEVIGEIPESEEKKDESVNTPVTTSSKKEEKEELSGLNSEETKEADE